jgi:uncharacterized protein YdaU (DUF1376 family)
MTPPGPADDTLADVMATIRLWQSLGITPPEAWRELGMRWSWGVEWWEVPARHAAPGARRHRGRDRSSSMGRCRQCGARRKASGGAMSQAPAMPVFTDALIGDTTHLSAEEFGCYFLLLCATWRNNGQPFSDNARDLARICRVTTRRWQKTMRARIAPFFNLSDGTWRQKRLEKECKDAPGWQRFHAPTERKAEGRNRAKTVS